MNVSNHAYERYCERFLNIKDTKEIKKYLDDNRDKVYREINTLYDGSLFIYHGKLGTDEIANFYFKDQTIIVVNDVGDCVKTLYKVDFGFPDHINQNVIDGLIEVIEDLRGQIENEATEQYKQVTNKEVEMNLVDMEIKEVEERLKYLNSKKSIINQEINLIKQSSNDLKNQLTRYAYQLCNSLDYRKEILKKT